jgi:hypothetical protein
MGNKRTWLIVLFASILVLALGAGPRPAALVNALAPAGTSVPYSGHLGDEAGQPVVNGAYDLTFELYDAPEGGNLLWSETQTGVAVRGGSFNSQLGSVNPLPAAVRGSKQWLAVGVRGPGETAFTALNPRQPLSIAAPASPTGGAACPHDHWGESWSGTGLGLLVASDSTAVWGEGSLGVYGHSPSGTGVKGVTSVTTGDTTGVWGQIASSGTYARAVVGWATKTSDTNYGVWGQSQSSAGIGVYGTSPNIGVQAISTGIGRGVQAVSVSGNAVYAKNTSGSGAAIYGDRAGGTAGYFNGDVEVNGTLSKSAGGFKIDHPLDPENQYLNHSFVESPDMKNVYDGVVTLDTHGEAMVTLPAWFGVLNRDFRYQLTCIGGFAPVYIAEEIQDNQFKIAGGKPGLKVSWQVTGIRQDPYANEHRIPVEEDKAPDDRGKYLHPELYGQPETMQIDSAKGPQNE